MELTIDDLLSPMTCFLRLLAFYPLPIAVANVVNSFSMNKLRNGPSKFFFGAFSSWTTLIHKIIYFCFVKFFFYLLSFSFSAFILANPGTIPKNLVKLLSYFVKLFYSFIIKFYKVRVSSLSLSKSFILIFIKRLRVMINFPNLFSYFWN
jgi:hypothetical protein